MAATDITSGMTGKGIDSRLVVLLFSDIVGSVDLKLRLGTPVYAEMLSRHDAIFNAAIAEVPGAKVLQNTGDGFLASFDAPSDAVRFALLFQSRMASEPWRPERLWSRVGIHLGELQTLEAAVGAAADNSHFVGLAIDFASRIMSVAVGGQILLTRPVFDDARQFTRDWTRSLETTSSLKWLAHGAYQFKGSDEPIDVYEVGIENVSPLKRPPDSEKARRVVPHDQEIMFGPDNPRPAVGIEVPNRPNWRLTRKLGEGGFGEVWLAEHEKLHDERVFKFCFNVDRIRSLKREFTFFRLIKEALGDRSDIAKLYDYNLEKPPFYLESEFTTGGSLVDWSDSIGGIKTIPLTRRLEILAQVCDAVAAAHSVGVLHKDIKPSNILIHLEKDGRVQPRLADFGIGLLANRSAIDKLNITETGFTQISEMSDSGSSRTGGTRMYSPPEAMANRPSTVQGDIYALGVLLYQMVIGDLTHPLAVGWERDVENSLLRDDIAICVDGDCERRLSSAAMLASRLRELPSAELEIETKRTVTKTLGAA